MSSCIFCNIIDKKIPASIVYEDDNFLCFKDINPSAPVHLLLITKKHIESLSHFTNNDSELIGKMMLKVPEIAKISGLINGFKTIINTGKDGGQIVFHVHIHILGTPVQ